ncbi:copper resistance protein B [Robiginitomaculum antarcticum]|uniref:copper resistance protein B n=1 Tax=Robiginitomaculum antarcticum TaxID=437507 RepID=UPI000367CFDB|nr:copper resistance protein B [Robiginitomaculum antarcticum]
MTLSHLIKFASVAALTVTILSPAAFAQDSDDPAPWSMADKYWGADVMARSREAVQKSNGNIPNFMIMGDRLEWQDTDGDGSFLWDAQGWFGGDINKLYIKTEGEYALEDEEIEDAEVQALYSRAIAPFWDLQAGVRYDLEPKGRTHAVLGVQGLAPYWFEIDAAAFLSTDGDLSASVEAEYDLRFTQRITLQPRAEIGFSATDIPELDIGSGITNLDAGLRLRYEIRREFAPYIGVEWQKSFGDTADFVRRSGGDPDKIVAVIGLRTWF